MKILVIQTAFIGDVILATATAVRLKAWNASVEVHFLVRRGHEEVLKEHPCIDRVWTWEKRRGKWRNLLRVIGAVRRERFDRVVNLHRFASSGLVTVCAGADHTAGFSQNPLSRFFHRRFPHAIGKPGKPGPHEVERNQLLIEEFTGPGASHPLLVPSPGDEEKIAAYTGVPFITISPASVWFTKQWPAARWIDLINHASCPVFLLGAPGDEALCRQIQSASDPGRVTVLAGTLSLLQSAALMRHAEMNYVNDSAPLHLCSAVNAPVTAVFCSTIPEFGFGPLSDRSVVAQTSRTLACRPCGLHGYKSCPEGHFECAEIVIAPPKTPA